MEKANNLDNKVAIMQPYFFPYIGYFQLIKAVNTFVLFDQQQYIKNGWINRNRIIEINREDRIITVPIKLKSRSQPIFDVDIDNNAKWQKSIINSIEFNYRRSPFFEELFSGIRQLLSQPFQKINDLNLHTLTHIVGLLDIKTRIISESVDFKQIEEFLHEPALSYDHRTLRVVNICKMLEAQTYINPIGGVELYKKPEFKECGLDLYFIKTKEYSYKQYTKTFIPHLSILDVLFCCGIEETKKMLDNYELI